MHYGEEQPLGDVNAWRALTLLAGSSGCLI